MDDSIIEENDNYSQLDNKIIPIIIDEDSYSYHNNCILGCYRRHIFGLNANSPEYIIAIFRIVIECRESVVDEVIWQYYCQRSMLENPKDQGSSRFEEHPKSSKLFPHCTDLWLRRINFKEGKIWEYLIEWRKAKISLYLKVSLNGQRDLTGKFALDTNSNYIPFDAIYSSESENEVQLIKRSNSLLPVKLIWFKEAEMPKKHAAYSGNSKSTKYRKIGPSGSFTKTAHSSLSITGFFSSEDNNIFDNNDNDYESINENNNEDNDDEVCVTCLNLLKGSRDGIDVKTIYNICVKVSNTVIVLKVKIGEILGGFNPLEWDTNKNQ
ncbi:hypothetical protein Glove_478g3 [Diversispora epigaea]|uniref:Uncharacterized protein n=1 Tax=Diversispora epigaea TaxID=1348612 RepID=A0A397GMD8_9GLOM|nr:hypothetical protein Glove_478g3 [Diversispora epigaea]